MTKAKTDALARSSIAKIERDDESGETWHREARSVWDQAIADANGDGELALERVEMPALPDFAADAPAHVRREIFGAYVVDRDAPGRPVVHSIADALESCGIDGIRSATFVHFWSEVVSTQPDAVAHSACIGELA